MSDIESIVIYGFAGYAIITDFYLMIFGVVRKLDGQSIDAWGYSYPVFFARKIFGVIAGLLLIVAYRSGTLDFFWSLVFFSILAIPEAAWMIYRDTKDRKEESLKAQDSPVEVQKTMQQNYRSSSDDDPNKDNDQELTTGEGKSGGNSGAGKSGGEDMGSEKPTMDERMGSRKHEGGNQEDEDGGKKDEPGK